MSRESMARNGIALYYPYLRCSDSWLKFSLLYWDEIQRIVPESLAWQLDDSEASRIASSAGLLVNASPKNFVDGAEKRFRDRVLPLVSSRRSPERKSLSDAVIGGMVRTEQSVELHRESFTRELASELTGNGIQVHYDKVTHGLVRDLKARRLASEEQEWLLMPNNVAGPYMSCLATEMSSRMAVPAVTNSKKFARGGEYLLFGHPPRKNSPADRTILMNLGIPFAEPNDLKGVKMERIIRFHEKFAGEKQAFRVAVSELVDELCSLQAPEAVPLFLKSRKREIQRNISDQQKRLDELKVKTVQKFLTLSCPSLLTAGGIAALAPASIAVAPLVVAGLTVSAVAAYGEHRGSKAKLVKESPWHYATAVHDEFGNV